MVVITIEDWLDALAMPFSCLILGFVSLILLPAWIVYYSLIFQKNVSSK